jgi:hypothetical protein
MDLLVQYIILTLVSGLLGLISFLLGAFYATPSEDPEVTISYLKDRVNLLETRENMRVLEDRELMLSLISQNKDHIEDADKKKPIQTKFRV